MKGILFIIDGLGDRPVASLGGCTPLEAAVTPFMDDLARRGRYGLVDPIAPGVLPNTHSGAGMLLGMKPEQVHRLQRGPVEAAGLGLELTPGDVAFRANFATLDRLTDGLEVLDRRAGRIREGTRELADALAGLEPGPGVTAEFIPTEQHRGVLVFRGEGLDARVTDTDPGDHAESRRLLNCRPLHATAQRTAAIVNHYCDLVHQILARHPVNLHRVESGLPAANGLVVRGAGHPVAPDSEVRARGLTASLVSGCNTVKGLGRLLGFRVIEDTRFTADLDTDLAAKIETAIDELDESDFAFVHIKAPDICAHDCNPQGKRDFLGAIDAAMQALSGVPVAIAIAADHTTDSNTGRHTADPVPALIATNDAHSGDTSSTLKFGESACRDGNLPRHDSHRFLKAFLETLGSD